MKFDKEKKNYSSNLGVRVWRILLGVSLVLIFFPSNFLLFIENRLWFSIIWRQGESMF